MVAWILYLIISMVCFTGAAETPATPPPTALYADDVAGEDAEWEEYHALAYAEYSDEFTRLFNQLETKWAKNGRLMIRKGCSGPFKFVKRTV